MYPEQGESPIREFVLASDYDKLAAENAALRATINEAFDLLKYARDKCNTSLWLETRDRWIAARQAQSASAGKPTSDGDVFRRIHPDYKAGRLGHTNWCNHVRHNASYTAKCDCGASDTPSIPDAGETP